MTAEIGTGRDEETLVAALRAGDEPAFARLVDEWSPAMLHLARAQIGSHAAAEEVVQEAWLAALRGLDGFEGRSRLRTWVFGIVINLARTAAAKERRSVPLSSTLLSDDAGPTVDADRFQGAEEPHPGGWRAFPAAWPATPEASLLAGEAHAVVARSIERLPDRQRTVILLRDVHGFEAEEVCRAMALTLGNQRVLLHRARAAVRQELERYFAGLAPSERS